MKSNKLIRLNELVRKIPILRFNSKNMVLKPYPTLLNLSRKPFTKDSNLIAIFTTHYYELKKTQDKYEDEISFLELAILLC